MAHIDKKNNTASPTTSWFDALPPRMVMCIGSFVTTAEHQRMIVSRKTRDALANPTSFGPVVHIPNACCFAPVGTCRSILNYQTRELMIDTLKEHPPWKGIPTNVSSTIYDEFFSNATNLEKLKISLRALSCDGDLIFFMLTEGFLTFNTHYRQMIQSLKELSVRAGPDRTLSIASDIYNNFLGAKLQLETIRNPATEKKSSEREELAIEDFAPLEHIWPTCRHIEMIEVSVDRPFLPREGLEELKWILPRDVPQHGVWIVNRRYAATLDVELRRVELRNLPYYQLDTAMNAVLRGQPVDELKLHLLFGFSNVAYNWQAALFYVGHFLYLASKNNVRKLQLEVEVRQNTKLEFTTAELAKTISSAVKRAAEQHSLSCKWRVYCEGDKLPPFEESSK